MNNEIELTLPVYIDTKQEKILKILMLVNFMVGISMFFNILYQTKTSVYFIRADIPLTVFCLISLVVFILIYFVKRSGVYSNFIKKSLDEQGFCKENAKSFSIELDRPYLEMVVSDKKTNELYKAIFDISSNRVELKSLNLIKKT